MRKKRSHRLKKRQKLSQLSLIENSILFLVPFLVGLGYADLFVFSAFLFITLRLIFFIKNQRYYNRWMFFKGFFNRIMWLLFSIIYLLYWRIENYEENNDDKEKLFHKLTYLGLVSIFIIVVGGAFEFMFLIIDFLIWLVTFIKKLSKYNKNKVKPEPKSKE